MALSALLVGDRAMTASAVQGIDPLEILNLQVKPNVLFVLDTSSAMGFNPEGTVYLGGDDHSSRLYQVKQALREVIAANDGRANFGIISLNANQAELALSRTAPMVYVSADRGAATWAANFSSFNNTFSNYDGAGVTACDVQPPVLPGCSDEIFESFFTGGAYAAPYQTRQYLLARLLRNNVRYLWDPTPGIGAFRRGLQRIDTIDCRSFPPPAGLLGDDTDEFNDGTEARACFQIENADVPGEVATYYLTSSTFAAANGFTPECDGTPAKCLVTPVPACTAGSNVAGILGGPLRTQLPLDPTTGLPINVPVTPVIATTELITGSVQPNAAGGLQLGGSRPLERALIAARTHFTGTVFPSRPAAVAGLQQNFVILIASGADNAGGAPTVTAAAMRGTAPAPGANDVTTMVVSYNGEAGFESSADYTALNALQSAGSLGKYAVSFGAANLEELRSSLGFAFSQAIATGTFATESSITESIYEYAPLAGAFDPVDPNTRYRGRVPVLLQSSFDMPGFTGHLKAFVNQGGASTLKWDAGVRLLDRIWNGPAGNDGMCPGIWTYNASFPGVGPNATQFAACQATLRTFAELIGSSPTSPIFLPNGRIKRRIFTTRANGVFQYDPADFGTAFAPEGAQCPVPLWPPAQTTSLGGGCPALLNPVAPQDDTTPGLFDEELGLNVSFPQLQSRYGACLGSPLPTACSDPALQLGRAKREAREMILAWTAGAKAEGDGIPTRVTSGPSLGNILYRARSWALAESTLGVPAVVPPPLEARPLAHTAEYLTFRDGLRNSGGAIAADGAFGGFGLRNPDRDAAVPTGNANGTGSNGVYEPLMSTVYHAANDMLHAFRGGPCPGNTCSLGAGHNETGGEELWGFVPFDQLEKLPERMQGQGRTQHTFLMASSVRFSDVFVPGDWTFGGRTFLGVWRTVLVLGRGIAGQRYTAIDITSPGQLNRASLFTRPGFAIWSRGNPDVNCTTSAATCPDGQAPNTPVRSTGGYVDDGENDSLAYARMGESWSVPAMTAVPPADFFDSEFAMFMGSGFSPNGVATEGKTFFAMDSLTGDILHAPIAPDTGNGCNTISAGEICPVPNAIVANPAAYVAAQLASNFVGNPAASTASLVYVGDLHGRMWKFFTSSPGLGLVKVQPDRTDSAVFGDSPDQPIGSAAALLNISGVPHVYWETGNDLRVLPPDNFKFIAMKDVGADVNAQSSQIDPAARLFNMPLSGILAGFRGTAQPATAFSAQKLGRVFFIGTKFTNQEVAGGNCRSSFDSVLFAVGAVSGDAVYDLDNSGAVTASDRSVMLSGTKVNALRAAMGQIVLDKGDIGTAPPPAPPAPAPAPTANEGSSGEVFVNRLKPGSAVCR